MTALYVLDVPENVPVVRVAAQGEGNRVSRVGPYFVVHNDEEIVVDRRATGCRHAVWYSCVGGIADGVRLQHDKDALRIGLRG